MEKNLFQKAIARENQGRPPVWFMRQAGRYHSHYQALRKQYSFIELCKKPEIACEVTMGPIRDFDFDAAILFSDLLFPLEAMGMGLRYEPGPKLDWHVRSPKDLDRLKGGAELASQLEFQAEAMRLIRETLPKSKGLLGFVGGPLTLFFYAAEGSHKGDLQCAHEGLKDGRYSGFLEKILDLLAHNMALQAKAGADTVAILDTCAGELDPQSFREHVVPALSELMSRFHRLCPDYPVAYYSKATGPEHWKFLTDLPMKYMGVDWKHDLGGVLEDWSGRWAIQGNIDPEWMLLPWGELEPKLRQVFERVKALPPETRQGWVCGLGHGILQTTPEENVRRFIRLQREIFS